MKIKVVIINGWPGSVKIKKKKSVINALRRRNATDKIEATRFVI